MCSRWFTLTAPLALLVLLGPVSCKRNENPVTPVTPVDPPPELPPVPIEVFPLSPGLVFHYDYYESLWEADPDHGPMTVDSGVVDYQIMDSVGSNAAARHWLIQETKHLLHYHYYLAGGYHGPADTSYWVDQIRADTLSESLTGFHNLACNFFAWCFPIQDSLVPQSDATGRAVLQPSRYAADSSVVTGCSLWSNSIPVSLTDTIGVRRAMGLTYRNFLHVAGMMSREIHTIHVNRRIL